MTQREISIAHQDGQDWTVEGQPITVPEASTPEPFLLAYAAMNFPPGTVALVRTHEGTRRITLRPARTVSPAVTAPTAPAPPSALQVPLEDRELPEKAPRKWRSRPMIISVIALVAIVAIVAVLIVSSLNRGATAGDSWAQQWVVEPGSGPVTQEARQLAGAGAILNISGGAAEAFAAADGSFIGSVLAPENSRIGVGPEFMVIATEAEGLSTGAIVTAAGIESFTKAPGVLSLRGTVPFLAGGKGTTQYALIYRGGEWVKTTTPQPGLAPLGVTAKSVVWLGTGRRIVVSDYQSKVTSESTLVTPTEATDALQRAFVTDEAMGVVWKMADGQRVLAIHSPKTGEVLSTRTVSEAVFDKSGDAIVSKKGAGVQYWGLTADSTAAPLAGDCPAPFPSGGQTWCKTSSGFAPNSGPALAPGVRPIPSSGSNLPAVFGGKLTLYNR